MEDAKEDALEEEQAPVDTSTTAALQSPKLSDTIKAAFVASMCSCSNIRAHVLLDQVLQAPGPRLQAQKEEEEERVLSAQKLDEDLDELSEERDQEDHTHGRSKRAKKS